MSLRNPLRERENNCALDEEDRGWKENFVFFFLEKGSISSDGGIERKILISKDRFL